MKTSSKQHNYLNKQFNDIEDLTHSVLGWGLDFRQLDCGDFKADVKQIGTESALLSFGRFNRHIDQKGSTPSGYRTLAIQSSGISNRLIWRNKEINTNDLMVFPPSGELSAVSWSGFNIFTISLSESLLSRISRRSGLPEFGDLTKNREVVTASNTIMMELRRLLHQIISMAGQNDKTENSDALYIRLEYLMPKMVLSILESARYSRSGFSRRRAKTLSRAEEIIKARIDEPLTVHKLSLLIGITGRALHYAFMEKYGVSPKSYLQATRFNAVRREIRNADPNNTKVTDIANRWGFWHMGQFAKDYRKFFGELPSETLIHP